MIELAPAGGADVQHLDRLLALGRGHLLPLQSRVGHGPQVAREVPRRRAGLTPHEGRGQLRHDRDVAQPLDRVRLGGEDLLAADSHALDQPEDERVRPAVLERGAGGAVQAQEVLGAVAALGRQLRALQRGRHRRRHVQLAPPRQLRQAGDVHRVQPDRRTDHHAHRGPRVRRVGQQPQPGQQVAHLGALEVGRGPVQAERQRPFLQRRAHHGAVPHRRGHQHGDPLGIGSGGDQPGCPGGDGLCLRALGCAAPEAHAAPLACLHCLIGARGRLDGGHDRLRAAQAAPQGHRGRIGERARELLQCRCGAGHRDLAPLLTQQRQERPLREVGVLVVVHQHGGQPARHAAAHMRVLVQKRERAEHQVARVQCAAVGQQPLVVGVQPGELAVAQRRRTGGVVAVFGLCQGGVGPGGQLAGGDHLPLEVVDPRHERGQQRGGVAADLVPAQRQLLQLLQQQRHPLGRGDRHEGGVQAGLDGLAPQQGLAERAEGVRRQLVVGRRTSS